MLLTFHEDGLFDVLVGVWMACVGAAMLPGGAGREAGLSLQAGSLALIATLAYVPFKTLVTLPRVSRGWVPESSFKVRTLIVLFAGVLCLSGVVLGLALRVMDEASALLVGFSLPLLFCGGGFTAFGLSLRIGRWVAYGLLLLLAMPFCWLAAVDPQLRIAVAWLVCGLIPLLGGGFVLFRFLAAHERIR